ncbi:MAG: hypothetical protein ACE5K0_11825, partial [Candidatus Methanofastidiosia archaeon]
YNPDCAIVDERGCPKDSDVDGINDCEDRCPEEKGLRRNKGCPQKVGVEILIILLGISVYVFISKRDKSLKKV